MCAGMCDRPFGEHRIDRRAPERQQPRYIIELPISNAVQCAQFRAAAKGRPKAKPASSEVRPAFDLDDLAMVVARVDAKVRCVSPPASLMLEVDCYRLCRQRSRPCSLRASRSPVQERSHARPSRSRAWNPVTCDRRLSGMRRGSSSIRKTTQYAILARFPVSSQTWGHTCFIRVRWLG